MGGGGKPELPPDSVEAKALAEVAAKRFNRYKEVFVPLENKYIQDVMDVRSQGTYETVGAMASADYAGQFAGANEQLATEMAQQGVDPGSGVFMGNSNALRKAQAAKQGLGVSSAKIDNTSRFYDGLSGIIAMGQGQASESIGGLQSLATRATNKAMDDASNAFQRSSATRAGIGQMVGLAASPFVEQAAGSSYPNGGGGGG